MSNPDAPHPSATSTAPSGQTFEDVVAFATTLSPNRRLLGLDLGTKTIGLALSDVMRTVATPFETLRRKKFTLDADALQHHIATHDICGLVLGLPRNMDGSEGPRAQSSRAFARNFNQRSPLPILLWDERLTTAAAERLLIEADASRARRAKVIDKMAAGLILQGAIDRLRQI